jgi:hypothetical protein
MLLPLLAPLLATAAGPVFEVELAVPASIDDSATYPSAKVATARLFKGVAPGVPVGTYTTATPEISCIVKPGGDVLIVAEFDPASWPTWPQHADCTALGTTVRVVPVMDRARTAMTHADVDLSGTLTVEKMPGEQWFSWHLLPGTDWVEWSGAATSNGGAWTHLSCEVAENALGEWFLRLEATDGQPAYGTGACEAPRASGGTTSIDVALQAP